MEGDEKIKKEWMQTIKGLKTEQNSVLPLARRSIFYPAEKIASCFSARAAYTLAVTHEHTYKFY